ncbi:FAD dependent oxidoreductase, putative [Synechococcus sp. PCC 7335]|uniref:geranylgeranyl reductase family protein n=1 Tax=Synechococcus sp. (strain ATCC 29403 / PCC 7335) TaxID=91464 RepID=UPI00017EB4A8|nr:geranylgeranyl reductase family protein [Synechococcus sp. PCC 7335]EDX85107.1 FAD dependent oxidoreductase, putative [Synechococcus sp. PCC 7335]
MFDCIIVGAGPAGSTAAYHLAKAGCSVLLLEKAELPRYKPCTGAVSPSVADWFDFDFSPAIASEVRQVRYTWKLGDAIDAELETDPIWSVDRKVFDQFLVEQAQLAGAKVQDQTTVTGVAFEGDHWEVSTVSGVERRLAERLTGRYVIAADGAKGPLAGWLGFREHKLREAGVLEVDTAALVEHGAFSFEFGLAKNGCLWSFPKPQGYSMGVSSFVGNSINNPQKLLSQYASAFEVNADQGSFYTHPLKLWDGNYPLHTTQALIVGEAAAIVDPLTAEGIRPAMYSAMLAAQAVKAAIEGDKGAIANYTQLIHESWGADMQWAQRIATVFFRVPKIGYRVGIKRPTATKRLGQILAGEVSYADIANRVIKRISTSFIPGRNN